MFLPQRMTFAVVVEANERCLIDEAKGFKAVTCSKYVSKMLVSNLRKLETLKQMQMLTDISFQFYPSSVLLQHVECQSITSITFE